MQSPDKQWMVLIFQPGGIKLLKKRTVQHSDICSIKKLQSNFKQEKCVLSFPLYIFVLFLGKTCNLQLNFIASSVHPDLMISFCGY